jgi:hypothetical protein
MLNTKSFLISRKEKQEMDENESSYEQFKDLMIPGKGVMAVMMESTDPEGGDKRVTWDPDNEDEVEDAEKEFNEKIKKGWTAFKVKRGKKDEKIKKFDPEEGAIIFVPQMAGGVGNPPHRAG